MLFKLFVYIGLLSQMSCEHVVFKTRNIECLPNPKYVTNAKCYIKALNWNKAVAQMDCDLIKPLRNFSARVQLFKKDYTNKYQPFLIDVQANICEKFQKNKNTPYGRIALKVLQQYSKFNHSCPLEGHMFARGLYLDEKLVPVFPLGIYQLVVAIFENHAEKPREEWGTVKFYAEAMEMVKRRNKMPPKENYTATPQ